MVVITEDGTNFSTLTPRRTYEDDAVSARFSVLQQNLTKKQQPPRGGIWDVDDGMDVTETTVVTGSMELRRQLNTMLQLESPYMDIEDRMDTGESSRSDSSDSMLSLPEAKELDQTVSKMAVVKENKEKLKKKSTEESPVERSKRCRTSSITEVCPIKPPLAVSQIDPETQREMLAEYKPLEGATAEAVFQNVENHQPQDLTVVLADKESLIVTIEGSGSAAKTERRNLYHKEIADLRSIASIFENLDNNDVGRCESYSEDIKHLQRICMKLQQMGDGNYFPARSVKLVNPQTDHKLATNGDVVGEAAFTVLDDIHRNESQSTELPFCNKVSSKDNLQTSKNEEKVSLNRDSGCAFLPIQPNSYDALSDGIEERYCNQTENSDIPQDKSSEASSTECRDSFLEKIMNGTLPMRPIGSPPPVMAFGGSTQTIDNPNTIHPPTVKSSMSSTSDSISTEEMLHLKLLALQARNTDTKPSSDETSRVKAMEETDPDLEQLRNETLVSGSRGSPPPIAAFGSLSPVSPSRSKDSTNSKAQYESSSSATLIKSKPDQVSAIHMKSSTNDCITFLQPSKIINDTPKTDLVALLDEASLNFLKQKEELEDQLPWRKNGQQIEEIGEHKTSSQENKMDITLTSSTVNSQSLTSRTSKSCLDLSPVSSGSFKAKTAQHNNQRSSRKASDTSALYMAKEPKPKPVVIQYPETKPVVVKYPEAKPVVVKYPEAKPVVVKYPEAKPVVVKYPEAKPVVVKYPEAKPVVVKYPEAKPARYIPPHQRQKSTWKSDVDISRNPQDQGFKTSSWANWRKEDSPPVPMNNLGSNGSKSYNDQASKLNDNYKKQPPNEEKLLNNVKVTVPGSDSEPSVTSFKPNSTANNYRTKYNSEKFLNNPRSEYEPSPRTYKPNSTSTANNYRTRHHSNGEKFSKAKSSENLNSAMISVKIFDDQNSVVDELLLNGNLLDQRLKLFKNLFEVVPMYDEKDKVLDISGSAVQTFLRSVFSLSYNIPGWKIALESYYLAKKYGFAKLQDDCKKYFNDHPIHPNEVPLIVHTARKFEITDVLRNSEKFSDVPAHQIPSTATEAAVKEPKCTVSCTVYSEPSAFCVPLTSNEERGLGSRRESDIKNDIIFESKSGTFSLVKLQIKLEAETKDLGKDVNIFCDFDKNSRTVFSLERRKRLNKLMIIDFKQRLLVRQGESVTISILIEDACVGMCLCLTREKEVGRCLGNGSFEVTFSSDTKSEAKQPLFFVEKLFYTFEGQKK